MGCLLRVFTTSTEEIKLDYLLNTLTRYFFFADILGYADSSPTRSYSTTTQSCVSVNASRCSCPKLLGHALRRRVLWRLVTSTGWCLPDVGQSPQCLWVACNEINKPVHLWEFFETSSSPYASTK